MLNSLKKPQTSSDAPFTGSITQKTLAEIAISATFIVIVATGFNYWRVFSTLKAGKLDQLEDYVLERVAREEEIFQLAADDHAVLKQEIIRQLQEPEPSDVSQQFERLFVRYPDGVIRNRLESFNGQRDAGVYIDKSLPITPQIKRKVLVLKTLMESYGRAWHNRFQSTFAMTPENITIVYWPEVPRWAHDADANYYMPHQEEYMVSSPENNPERKTMWTTPYLEDVSQLWLVTCSTPVYWNNQFIASLGHDVRLNNFIERTMNNNITGGYNIIFKADGQLIAHPDLMSQLEHTKTPYKIPESQNENLKNIFELVINAPPNQIILDNRKDGQYLAVQKIHGPDWYFVTVFPKSVLAEAAVKIALSTLFTALITLMALIGILYVILHIQIAEPLKKIIDATFKISEGNYNIIVPESDQNELGFLAHLFNLMIAKIYEKNHELELSLDHQKKLVSQIRTILEKQGTSVQEVTIALNQLSASAEASASQAADAAMDAQQVLLLVQGDDNSHQESAPENRRQGRNSNLQQQVEKLAQEIFHLSEKIRQIGLISSVVSNLANQTNMLALNAAVEAVRSGQHGQGFTVIASEIRQLADQSKASAAEINALVQEINRAMNSTVAVTDESKKIFETVVHAVNNIVVNSEKISLNARQQSVAIAQVLDTMTELNKLAMVNTANEISINLY